jgi:hypothetical protein
MSGSWQLLESSVMRGGYAWSEKGEYAEQYTDSASVEKNTGLAAAKAYTFEQHYVDAKGLTLPAGTVESGYGLMRMDGGVFSMAVVKGEAVAADGVRWSVYYGVAIGDARGANGSDAGSASGLGMGGSVLGNYLEEYYTPETMQGAGAFDIEVNLVLFAGSNGEIFGFNKDYMLTGGQVSSPEYEMSGIGMPYGWYAWHCEGAISPVLQNPNHQVPASLRTDEVLAAQYASQAYPVSNYVYYPVGSVNGQVVGVYMTYQDSENNYLLGQAVVPTGDGRSYIYNIYTANPGYYGDNASWQAANQYIVENLENNGSAMFGVQTMAFTRQSVPIHTFKQGAGIQRQRLFDVSAGQVFCQSNGIQLQRESRADAAGNRDFLDEQFPGLGAGIVLQPVGDESAAEYGAGGFPDCPGELCIGRGDGIRLLLGRGAYAGGQRG